jgi:thiol:disulfide interchange protein DsbD
MNMLPITLLALSLLLVVPAGRLLRRQGMSAQLGAILLLLVATASAYTGIRLHQTSRLPSDTPPPALIPPTPGSGHFQDVTAATLAATLNAAQGHPVLLDFHADWCSGCMHWQRNVFNQPDVQQAMRHLVLLRIDVTRPTPEIQTILNQHQLPGLPALLFFDRAGQEQSDQRLLGEVSADEFKAILSAHPPSLQ